MLSVIFTGSGTVHLLVVLPHQLFTPFRILPEPISESVTDRLLLLRRQSGLLGVQNAALLAVCFFYFVINPHVAEIQTVLHDLIGVCPGRAKGVRGRHVSVADSVFPLDEPIRSMRRVPDVNIVLEVARRFEGLKHKLLEDFRCNPGASDPGFDFRRVQILRLSSLQCFCVDFKERIVLRGGLSLSELDAHVAGEVFIRRLPPLIPMFPAVSKVKGTGGRVLKDDAVKILHNLRDVFLAAHEPSHKRKIHTSLLANRYGQSVSSRVHVVDTALLLNRALCKNVHGLVVGFSIPILFLQGAKQEIGRIFGKGQLVSAVIDQTVPFSKGVVEPA